MIRRIASEREMHPILFLFILCLFAPPVDLMAQDIMPGDRVRVLAPSVAKKRLTGTVVSLTVDSLVIIVPSGDPPPGSARSLSIPVPSVEILQVSLNRKAHVERLWQGPAIGFAIGVVLAIFRTEDGTDPSGTVKSPHDSVTGQEALRIGLIGAGIGFLVGAVLAIPREQWETRSLLSPSRRKLLPSDGPDAFGLAVQIHFW
jgi:hypothetical protein